MRFWASPRTRKRSIPLSYYAYSLAPQTRAEGTKKLLAEYGDRLVCVRYRCDAKMKRRWKTVALIVAESAWEAKPRRYAAETIVGVRIGLHEAELQGRARRAGGKWNRDKRVWEMRYDRVVACGLEGRIVPKEGS